MFCVKCGQALEQGKPFCVNCGAPAPAPAATAGAPQGGGRTGIMAGSIAAGIIVLAGLGVGLWLGLRDNGGETDSTKVVSSTTSSVASGGGTTSGSGGAATTQTIPSLTNSTGSGATGSTNTTADLLTGWYIAQENLVMEMDYENGRIPELAAAINSSAPDVPNWVFGELEDMAGILEAASQTMASTPVPPGFEDAHHWIMEAAGHMAKRIEATMNGISVMWYSGSINSATASFNTGRAERDAYLDALEEHYSLMPAD